MTHTKTAVIVNCAFVFTLLTGNICHREVSDGSMCGVKITVCLYVAAYMCADILALCTCILFVCINAYTHLFCMGLLGNPC